MIDCNKTIFYFLTLITSMSELDAPDIVVDTDLQDDVDTTNPDMPESFEYDDVVRMKSSLDKATSKYVLP